MLRSFFSIIMKFNIKRIIITYECLKFKVGILCVILYFKKKFIFYENRKFFRFHFSGRKGINNTSIILCFIRKKYGSIK